MNLRAVKRRAGLQGAASLLLAAAAGMAPAAAAESGGADAHANANGNVHASTGVGADWHLQLHTRHHSDATRLGLGRDPRAGDLTPRAGRNLAYIDDEVRLERRQAGWRIGLLARSRATLVASADTLALYQQVEGRHPITADRRWTVDARLRGFSGVGVALGRQHDLGDLGALGTGWSARWELQALLLKRWRERRLQGGAGATPASGEYDFALHSTQRDDHLSFPFQTAFPSRGSALLGGAVLAWQGARWQVEAAVNDAGWQHWRALPRQDAVLDSRTSAVDADGFLIYRPLVQGQNSQPTATRAAPAWGRLMARGRWDPRRADSVEIGADVLPGFGLLPWLGVAMPVGASQIGLQWRTHEQRLTLQWQWRGLTLAAGADRLGSGMRSRELGLGWRLPI